MLESDCDPLALLEDVRAARRAVSEHIARRRQDHALDAVGWERELEQLEGRHREARAAWRECADLRRGPFG